MIRIALIRIAKTTKFHMITTGICQTTTHHGIDNIYLTNLVSRNLNMRGENKREKKRNIHAIKMSLQMS